MCESLQLAARESISIRGKGIYSFTNETSCRYEALFQINSSGPLVQPDDKATMLSAPSSSPISLCGNEQRDYASS